MRSERIGCDPVGIRSAFLFERRKKEPHPFPSSISPAYELIRTLALLLAHEANELLNSFSNKNLWSVNTYDSINSSCSSRAHLSLLHSDHVVRDPCPREARSMLSDPALRLHLLRQTPFLAIGFCEWDICVHLLVPLSFFSGLPIASESWISPNLGLFTEGLAWSRLVV